MANSQDQQYCLRWNNFQANITSQFEALRDDEEFTDVTIACEGKRLQAHKVVLSACSPFFKELFKTNPCSHPIIFMRDVEALHVAALMEFMYAGEVNIAQAHLSSFLKTAESLKIRGLTDTSTESELRTFLNQKPSPSCSNAVSSSQDQDENYHPPEAKRLKPDLADNLPLEVNEDSSKNKLNNENSMVNPFAIQHQIEAEENRTKIELPDYMSADEDRGEIHGLNGFFPEFSGGMEIIPQTSNNNKEASTEEAPNPGMNDQISVDLNNSKRLHSLDPRPCSECGRTYSNLSNLRQHIKLIHNPTLSTCQFCQKAFKSDLYLRRHLTNNHSSSTTTNNNNNNNNNSGTNYNNYF